MTIRLGTCLLVFAMCVPATASQTGTNTLLKPGAKVFIHPMSDDFDSYLKLAIAKKNVPVTMVATREQAEFEIKGSSETQKAGAAKKIMMLNWHSDEQASISVASLESGEIVFAYTAHKKSSARGKRSSAEACAKHLKKELEKRK